MLACREHCFRLGQLLEEVEDIHIERTIVSQNGKPYISTLEATGMLLNDRQDGMGGKEGEPAVTRNPTLAKSLHYQVMKSVDQVPDGRRSRENLSL